MKNLFYLSVIFFLVLFEGCKEENPVSAKDYISYSSLGKSTPLILDPLTEPFSGSFQSSGYFSNSSNTSILELFGEGSASTLGKCKIFSHTKITSTTQSGSIEIITDKGEKISGSLSGTVESGKENILYFTGRYNLQNGTGRLAGIKGDGAYSGNINKNGIDGKFVLDGVIRLPEIIKVDRNIE